MGGLLLLTVVSVAAAIPGKLLRRLLRVGCPVARWRYLGNKRRWGYEVDARAVSSPPGLTPEQEAWLGRVTHRNVSGSEWPQLSSNQSAALLKNVRAFQNMTEIVNYPYHQAGKSVWCCSWRWQTTLMTPRRPNLLVDPPSFLKHS